MTLSLSSQSRRITRLEAVEARPFDLVFNQCKEVKIHHCQDKLREELKEAEQEQPQPRLAYVQLSLCPS